MRPINEIEDRIRGLFFEELRLRGAEAEKRLPARCIYNKQNPLDSRSLHEGEPNDYHNRITTEPWTASTRTIGLCMYGSKDIETWPGNLCEDAIDAQRCPLFTPLQSKAEILAEFMSDISNVAYKSASVPIPITGGGSAAAYWLMGRKWTQTDPQVKMSIKDDALFASTGMSRVAALAAVSAAANTWDDSTPRNLFFDLGANFTNTVNWKYDHINNMAFTPYATGCSALAATGVWYKTQGIPAGQMYPIVESDMTFNSNLKWTTTGESGKLDFQSVVLHELGHTVGLGDLYSKVQFKSDTRQVMHYYSGVKRTLGNGDIYGLWMLYN